MKLSTLLLVVFAIIGTMLTIQGGLTASRSLYEFRDVQRASTISSAEATAMDATIAMSLERSVMQVALAFSEPIPQNFRDIITEQRDTADSGLADALNQVAAITFLSTNQAYIDETRASLERVASIRAEVDALLSVPLSERDPARVYNLPFELKKEVVTLRNATDLLRNRNGISTQVAGILAAVQLKSWEVREFGGRARTYFAIATLTGEKISAGNKSVLETDNARAREAWLSLKNSVLGTNQVSDEIAQGITAAEELYFGEYVPLIARLKDQSAAGVAGSKVAYEMSFQDFFATSNAALGTMESLSAQASKALIAYWDERRSVALLEAVGSCLFATISLLGLAFIYFMLRIRVVGLLGAATRILTSLASGDLDIKIRSQRRELSEIKALYATVESFRSALLEAKRAEAEAHEATAKQKEAEAREAEKEKEATAERARKADAERAEAEARYTRERQAASEIAKVVEACAAGDFSGRLRVDDKDGIFAEICDGMNRIGEAADTGLGAVQTALSEVAKGNLTYRMPLNFAGVFEDIAKAVNDTTESLSKTMSDISMSAASLNTASHEISEATQNLATRSTKNAANLAQTAQELEQMTRSVKSAAAATETASASFRSIEDMARNGNTVLTETIEAMSEIKSSSDEIGSVLKLIDEIAFQTNLLALNAGVEAARAGDAGRGFAVVATEVRALAQRSSNAAREIADLIETSSNQVKRGVDLVNNSGEALGRIVSGVEDASTKLNEIFKATTETSTGISEISKATSDLDDDTKQNSEIVEETGQAARSLKGVASKMTKSISAFQVGDIPHQHASAA
jgi:methyl-accepting chemotaxis protein